MGECRIYPLKFEPIYKEKVWGGRAIETLGRRLPGGRRARIGESWELADLGATAASGGGGEAARSAVANGPLAGTTLHELLERRGPELLGGASANAAGEFPLLVKFLDAQENLSVQVHPSPAYAAEHPDAHVKHEAWYVVSAAEGAAIYKGLRPGTRPEALRAALEANDAEAVEAMLERVPVRAGDCHYLPSGTCHALGAGVLVAEAQTPSDTTFRVFDWGRTGRELHIDEAMASMRFGPADAGDCEIDAPLEIPGARARRRVACGSFHLDEVSAEPGAELTRSFERPCVAVMIAGGGLWEPADGATPVGFATGTTLLLPPGMGKATFTTTEPSRWLEIHV